MKFVTVESKLLGRSAITRVKHMRKFIENLPREVAHDRTSLGKQFGVGSRCMERYHTHLRDLSFIFNKKMFYANPKTVKAINTGKIVPVLSKD